MTKTGLLITHRRRWVVALPLALIGTLVATFFGWAPAARAVAVIHAGSGLYANLQDAIDHAAPGDTVDLDGATYQIDVLSLWQPVTLTNGTVQLKPRPAGFPWSLSRVDVLSSDVTIQGVTIIGFDTTFNDLDPYQVDPSVRAGNFEGSTCVRIGGYDNGNGAGQGDSLEVYTGDLGDLLIAIIPNSVSPDFPRGLQFPAYIPGGASLTQYSNITIADSVIDVGGYWPNDDPNFHESFADVANWVADAFDYGYGIETTYDVNVNNLVISGTTIIASSWSPGLVSGVPVYLNPFTTATLSGDTVTGPFRGAVTIDGSQATITGSTFNQSASLGSPSGAAFISVVDWGNTTTHSNGGMPVTVVAPSVTVTGNTFNIDTSRPEIQYAVKAWSDTWVAAFTGNDIDSLYKDVPFNLGTAAIKIWPYDTSIWANVAPGGTLIPVAGLAGNSIPYNTTSVSRSDMPDGSNAIGVASRIYWFRPFGQTKDHPRDVLSDTGGSPVDTPWLGWLASLAALLGAGLAIGRLRVASRPD